MIYLASRSAWKYLRKLREISLRQNDYHLVSITGGLASLHAVGERTRSLVFVDSDPEVNEYGKNITEALLSCPRREDFFELLSGKEVQIDEQGKINFLRKESTNRALILNKLSQGAASCISRWYVSSSFNHETATMSAEGKTVHFFGLSLQIQHFNWHADWGAFSSEDSYRVLFEALTRLTPVFLTLPLEEYDFVNCPEDTLILASNTDSPLFTQKDAVLRAMEVSGSKSCSYVSRTRDFSSLPSERISILEEPLKLPPILVGIPENALEELRVVFSDTYKPMSYAQYYRQLFYDEELILFWAGEGLHAERLSLAEHLQSHQPIHQRVGIVTPLGDEDPTRFAEILTRYEFQETVRLNHGVVTIFSLSFRTPY